MKLLSKENLESILYMTVNFGESPKYAQKIQDAVNAIAELENFSLEFVKKIVEAGIVMEVANCAEVYTDSCGMTEGEIVQEFIKTFRKIVKVY